MNYKKRLRRDRWLVKQLVLKTTFYQGFRLLNEHLFMDNKERPGYYKCFQCNGTGLMYIFKIKNYHLKKIVQKITFCKYCNGKGGLTWVDFITKGINYNFIKNNKTF
jgi:hypothetical protein